MSLFQISSVEQDHLACLNNHSPPSDNILKVFLKDDVVSNILNLEPRLGKSKSRDALFVVK